MKMCLVPSCEITTTEGEAASLALCICTYIAYEFLPIGSSGTTSITAMHSLEIVYR